MHLTFPRRLLSAAHSARHKKKWQNRKIFIILHGNAADPISMSECGKTITFWPFCVPGWPFCISR
jgi:hypothetical protein